MSSEKQDGDWFSEFNRFTEERLNGSIRYSDLFEYMESWYHQNLVNPIETETSPIQQALICLSTEIILSMPPDLKVLFDFRHEESEEALIKWLCEVLNFGRNFEQALQIGELDKL